jgi:NodT family efflux transporter outer membrane factor (OMF) lipoprotein
MITSKKICTARRMSLVGLLLLLHACTVVGPDYVRPTVDVPAKFKEANSASLFDEKNTDAQSGVVWWSIYADNELDNLMRQIEQKNYSLQAYAARVRQAQAIAAIAQAEKLPNVVVGGTNDFGIRVNWELDLWGRIQRSIESNNANVEATLADVDAIKLSLQAQLAQNYFLLRAKDADLVRLDEMTSAYEKLLKITRNQYAVGVSDKGSIAQAQAQFATSQAQVQDARITRQQLEHAIAVLVGKAPADFSISTAPLASNVPTIPANLPSELLQRRADIIAAERRMLVANAQIGAAEASKYPKFDIAAGVSVRKGGLGGLRLAAPIYSGAPNAPREKAEADFDENVANYRQTVLTSFLEVEDNLAAQNILTQAYIAQDLAASSSRQAAQIAQNQYQAGILTYQAMLEVKAANLTNERATLALQGRRLLASVALVKALGGTWQTSTSSSSNQAIPKQAEKRRENEVGKL